MRTFPLFLMLLFAVAACDKKAAPSSTAKVESSAATDTTASDLAATNPVPEPKSADPLPPAELEPAPTPAPSALETSAPNPDELTELDPEAPTPEERAAMDSADPSEPSTESAQSCDQSLKLPDGSAVCVSSKLIPPEGDTLELEIVLESGGLRLEDAVSTQAGSFESPDGRVDASVRTVGRQSFVVLQAQLSDAGTGGNDCDRDFSQSYLRLYTIGDGAIQRVFETEAERSREWVQCWIDDEKPVVGGELVETDFRHFEWLLLDRGGVLELQAVAYLDAVKVDEGEEQVTVRHAGSFELLRWRQSASGSFEPYAEFDCPVGSELLDEAVKWSCVDAQGQRQGPYREWSDSDRVMLIEEATYLDGKRVGAYGKWSADGQPKLVGSYDLAGEASGVWVAFHPNGVPRKFERFVAGKLQGQTLRYDEEGVLQ